MARPVEFEYDEVLTNAMEQFWKEGYEASSVQKLLDATSINRGTLYNSFGDKDTFFKSCLSKYNEIINADLDQTLNNKELDAKAAIEQYFDQSVITLPAKKRVMGCLLVNSVCESINWDKDIQKLLKNSLNNVRKAFLGRTRELEKSRKLQKGLSAETAADQLMNAWYGLRVNARNGRTPKQLAETAGFTVNAVIK